MRKLTALALAACATAASATPPVMGPPPPAPPPRLLIVISVDQLSSDLFDEYRPMMLGGLGRLSRGTVFSNGYQAQAATETCPGHSTILTGAYPARSGVIANVWVDQSLSRSDKSVYCAEDESIPGSSSSSYAVSPVHLKVPTLGERLKANWTGSQNVAVGGKDRSAVMMGGRQIDQRWYWDGERFASDHSGRVIPASVARANAAVTAMLATAQAPLDPPELCQGKARPIAIEGADRSVGDGRFARAGGDAAAFRASPAFDGAVLALAAGLIGDLKLGRDASPDILSIGLSGTDYVGHSFGSGGQEMCLQLLSLDRDLGDFFRMLDQAGLDYAVALTADHGGQDVPERLRLRGIAAARVDAALEASEVGKRIGVKLGLPGPVLIGDIAGDIYVDRSLKPADRARALREALAIYVEHRQVEAVFTSEQVARTPIATNSPDRWSMIERVRASFDPQRSGDLIVLLRKHVTPIAKPTKTYVATHGSPWNYDRRVPILFWRLGMPTSDRREAIATVDIMPTLAAAMGLRIDPSSVDGKCLGGIQGIACPPR